MRILLASLMVVFMMSQADARPKHHRHHGHHVRHYVSQAGSTYLPHPSGCPRTRFCGCGAASDLFGRPIRSLWSSVAWLRFPRTVAAHRMAAVRRGGGHVFILDRHAYGDVWWVRDYNSGGHRSRYHMRSIRGYAIVNPHASRYASGSSHAL